MFNGNWSGAGVVLRRQLLVQITLPIEQESAYTLHLYATQELNSKLI